MKRVKSSCTVTQYDCCLEEISRCRLQIPLVECFVADVGQLHSASWSGAGTLHTIVAAALTCQDGSVKPSLSKT
jgi:hypothetical protein